MADPLHDNPRSPKEADPNDYTERYNTKLSDEDEGKFQEFVSKRKGETGRDLSKDLYDYDVRGWWKEGADTADNGHGPDAHKKPNHPTFSGESKYSGKDGLEGGAWGKKGDRATFKPGKTNRAHHSKKELRQYFKDREPDVDLEDD